MHDPFERKVTAAAVAAWWTVLWAMVFLAVSWFVFVDVLPIMGRRLLFLWGEGISLEEIRRVSLWIFAVFKLCVWLMALAALWLTLWARRLRRQAGPR